MSHMTQIELEIKDLQALKNACAKLGFQFVEGQTTYKWYGRFMGDYPLPEGIRKEDLGKCDHAIVVPGAGYEVGVVKKEDKYILLWDFYKAGGLANALGQNGKLLKIMYSTEKVKLAAKRKHYKIIETRTKTGEVVLTLRK